MTHRSIVTLVTLFVALFIASQATVVNAHDVCGDPPGQWCVAMATPATAPTVQYYDYLIAQEENYSSTMAARAQATSAQTRFLENRLPSQAFTRQQVIEDYVSDSPPANSVAIMQACESCCIMIPSPCEIP